ncbi:hypothetical protein [Brevundimonas sp. SL130]|uniref:hypothetical protein n=1 Tax=Brevundimonas sp. SL130 TaxID=2995143 RepID=UPI00226C83A4|nr:hypothetical protein [Brevundimonas sp. SL130]WAC59266.1 hypothetical protein OU998_13730 [Brevundimonas sp. SL130]
MNDPDVIVDDARRAYWRIIGWGGALIFSLLVWAAVFWLVGRGLDRQPGCEYGAATSVSCPSAHEA